MNKEEARQIALTKIESIHAVEGFDPTPLALEIGDMNDGGLRYRLPVMAQMAWFRLKYPEGKISVSVKEELGSFVAEARVYVSYKDPIDCFLAESSASRSFLPEKPSISPREWAQTAAIGMALRNAGFGLQFAAAGESYEDNLVNDLAAKGIEKSPTTGVQLIGMATGEKAIESPSAAQPELTPLEKAMVMLCPIQKYKDKTLGEMVRIDPGALAYVAKNGVKYGEEIANCATLICEEALRQASA